MTKNYTNLSYSQEELQRVMRQYYDKIIDFVTTESFKNAMLEMSKISAIERPVFVTKFC